LRGGGGGEGSIFIDFQFCPCMERPTAVFKMKKVKRKSQTKVERLENRRVVGLKKSEVVLDYIPPIP
jgi:hypothetical protein